MYISDEKIVEIRRSLLDLNDELEAEVVAGFWVENGDIPGEVYANVVYIMEPISNKDNWPMDKLDDLCGLVSSRLRNLVTYTYCWFRTEEEFEKEFPEEIKLRQVS